MPESGHDVNTTSAVSLWVPPAFIAIVILGLSSIPGRAFPSHPDFLNVVVHFAEFFGLSFFLARALLLSSAITSLSGVIIISLASGVVFGTGTEIYQFAIPERLFDPGDIFVDSLGALFGALLFVLLSMTTSIWKDKGKVQ